MSAQVLELGDLRELLSRRFPDAVPVTYRSVGAVATGIGALDRLLPGGGFPRGRLSQWVPGGGATAVLRAACGAVVGEGERAAWVDGAGLLAGDAWERGPLLVRPGGGAAALGVAEELARSGGFALVVVSGVGDLEGEAVRLSRAVREGGGALVVLARFASVAALRLRSRIAAEGWRWGVGPFGDPVEAESVTVRVQAKSLGWSGRAEFTLGVAHHDARLCLDPGLVDRRGARR